MSDYTFILNPEAGKGGGKKVIPTLTSALRALRLDHDLHLTQRVGHATELAATSESHAVVAVGGDGTINEVANALVGTKKVMGIIPIGSGNDFVRSVGIPKNFEQALKIVLQGHAVEIDAGTVECSTRADARTLGNSKPRHFVNGVGVGFDAAVAERTRHIKYVTGTALYLLALFQTLWKYRSPHFDIVIDGNNISAKKFLIAIGNGKCVGGGFYLTPDARLDDGLLDICLVDDLPVREIIQLIPRVLNAKLQDAKGVAFTKGSSISVSSDTPFFVHADGELVGRSVTNVNVSLRRKCLSIIAPY